MGSGLLVYSLSGEGASSLGTAITNAYQTALTSMTTDVSSFITTALPVGLGIFAAFCVIKFGKKFVKTVIN